MQVSAPETAASGTTPRVGLGRRCPASARRARSFTSDEADEPGAGIGSASRVHDASPEVAGAGIAEATGAAFDPSATPTVLDAPSPGTAGSFPAQPAVITTATPTINDPYRHIPKTLTDISPIPRAGP